jgi:hypothetical protein
VSVAYVCAVVYTIKTICRGRAILTHMPRPLKYMNIYPAKLRKLVIYARDGDLYYRTALRTVGVDVYYGLSSTTIACLLLYCMSTIVCPMETCTIVQRYERSELERLSTTDCSLLLLPVYYCMSTIVCLLLLHVNLRQCLVKLAVAILEINMKRLGSNFEHHSQVILVIRTI